MPRFPAISLSSDKSLMFNSSIVGIQKKGSKGGLYQWDNKFVNLIGYKIGDLSRSHVMVIYVKNVVESVQMTLLTDKL